MSVIATGTRPPDTVAGRRLGLLLVVSATLFWSTGGFFTRLVSLDGWTIQVWRGLFGVAMSLAILAVQERGRVWPVLRGLDRTDWLFSVVSAIGMTLFVSALRLTTVAHVATIYATIPFVSAALAWLVMRERVPKATMAASALAMAGIVLTVMDGFGEGRLAGDALTAVMTVAGAVMIVMSRRNPGIPMVAASAVSSAMSALACLPFASPGTATALDLLYLAGFAATNIVLGFLLFLIGARMLPAAETALIGSLEAPLAPVWVWLAFGETPGAATIAGGVLVLVAVFGNVLLAHRE